VIEDTGSETYEETGHESELDPETAAEVDELIKSHLQVMEQLKRIWGHKASDPSLED
jgi:hypothetical protein